VNLLPLTSEVFKRLATSDKLEDTNCLISGLDPHMIIKLEDELNHGPCLWLWLFFCYISSISFNVGWYELIP
jgi:hypothetical protein